MTEPHTPAPPAGDVPEVELLLSNYMMTISLANDGYLRDELTNEEHAAKLRQLTAEAARRITALLVAAELRGGQFVESELRAAPKDSWYGTLQEAIDKLQQAAKEGGTE